MMTAGIAIYPLIHWMISISLKDINTGAIEFGAAQAPRNLFCPTREPQQTKGRNFSFFCYQAYLNPALPLVEAAEDAVDRLVAVRHDIVVFVLIAVDPGAHTFEFSHRHGRHRPHEAAHHAWRTAPTKGAGFLPPLEAVA